MKDFEKLEQELAIREAERIRELDEAMARLSAAITRDIERCREDNKKSAEMLARWKREASA